MNSGQLDLFTPIIDETENEVLTFRYEITSYGADYPVDSLVRRLKNKTIFVPPFQRRFVWNKFESSKFIESLLLGLPVPGIFLSKEPEMNKLLIVDGQQRLLSLLFCLPKFPGPKIPGISTERSSRLSRIAMDHRRQRQDRPPL